MFLKNYYVIFYNKGMKVWLDDIRPMPEGYDIHAYSAAEAIELLKSGKVTEISLDHDLADLERDGYEVACWIEKHAYDGTLPKLIWKIHSANPVGVSRMRSALTQAEKWWSNNG